MCMSMSYNFAWPFEMTPEMLCAAEMFHRICLGNKEQINYFLPTIADDEIGENYRSPFSSTVANSQYNNY